MKATVIGAGLAGCEAANALASYGIQVDLYEQKPAHYSPAHKYPGFAELVCSNSLKASRLDSASGMLKEEMRLLRSLIVPCAEQTAVAAGGALAVDREHFSDLITCKIRENPLIHVVERQVATLDFDGPVVVATGPLTSDNLAQVILSLTGSEHLSFYDAAAPIVTAESVDQSIAFAASRYGRGDGDYLNCPMDREEYEAFLDALVHAESVPLKSFEQEHFKVYEGCMPIEVMAKRGSDTIRFGPLKPVGLIDPRTGHRPWAVVQLRKENAEGSLYNIVGFQTNLKWGEQKRVFSMIPSLQNAEFIRYGVMHRNTFLDSPRCLNRHFQMKNNPSIWFAGQLTGVEGYVESAASGLIVGHNLARTMRNMPLIELPKETMLGALSDYISDETKAEFQPMGSNMGILPPLSQRIKDKKERYRLTAQRGIDALQKTLSAIAFQ